MSPAEVDACSLWQFFAAVEGWNAAHGAKDGPAITPEQEDDLWQGVIDRSG